MSVCLKGEGDEHCEKFEFCEIQSPVEQVQNRLIELFNSISVDQITEDILDCPEKTYLSVSRS